MLKISNGFKLISTLQNSSASALRHTNSIFSLSFSLRTLNPKSNRLLLFIASAAMSSASPPASVKIVAEYAKSGRSSCKKCSQSIAAKSLRLGLVSKDPRGFDMTKWHHLDCFPFTNSDSVSSAKAITGFSSLESSDQESVKKLADEGAQDSEKVDKMDENEDREPEQGNTKKQKLSATVEGAKVQVEIASAAISSSSSPPASVKIVAEYAKSGRSSCKKCSQSIAAKSLRLGLVSKDPRGFDMTKWHHLDCFPFTNSDSVSSAEAIIGFSSLESSDQESLKKLADEGAQASEKVDKMNEKEDKEPDQGNMKKQKLSASVEGAKVQVEIAISSSDIKDKYKDATLLPKWKAFQTVIFLETDDGLHGSRKIAAFDFDGCLAKTSVRRVGADAWSLMYPSIPEKLQSLYEDGYKLVIFTNESNIERWKNKRQAAVDSKIGRLENFIKLVKVPMQVFIACGLSSVEPADLFRKPSPGMWKIMEKEFNSGLPIDIDQSFYVGDTAGRPDDHSDADKKFAEAVGLKFFVPEDYFIGSE